MDFWVGITDHDWFTFLSELNPDEVNFWSPSAKKFRAIGENSLFLFKLHSPYNYIVGCGLFTRYVRLPLSLAWDTFGEKNGAPNYASLLRLVQQYRKDSSFDPEIGCIILVEPFFFEEQDWIPQPKSWASNIVTGKRYSTQDADGLNLWEQVQERLQHIAIDDAIPSAIHTAARFGPEAVIHPRLGQGAFRALVTDSYYRRCAVTNERTLPALEAAHIKPYSLQGPHEVRNGLLLRSDIHRLFERGYLTITSEMEIVVSSRIREEYENGHEYYAYDGHRLAVVPRRTTDRPSEEYLDWHNNEVYRG